MRTIKTTKHFIVAAIFIMVANSCKKENSGYPKQLYYTKTVCTNIEAYTKQGKVENHDFTFDDIKEGDYFTSHLIDEIIFNSKTSASLKYKPSSFQETLEFFGKDMDVSYKNDSILFYLKQTLEGYITDIRGKGDENSVNLNGIYITTKSDTYGTFDYCPFDKQSMLNNSLNYIWPDGNAKNTGPDTLILCEFELLFSHRAK